MVQQVQIVPGYACPPRPSDPKLREEWVAKWCHQTVKRAEDSYNHTCYTFRTDDPAVSSNVREAAAALEDAKIRARLVKAGRVQPLEEELRDRVPKRKQEAIRRKYEKKVFGRELNPGSTRRGGIGRLVWTAVKLVVVLHVLAAGTYGLAQMGLLGEPGAKLVAAVDQVRRAAVEAKRRADGPLAGPPTGFTVTAVDPQSGAAAIGLRPGDVLTDVNGTPVATLADVRLAVGTAPAAGYDMSVFRGNHRVTLHVNPGQFRVP